MTRTAETLFVGDASSVERAARAAALAVDGAAGKIEGANTRIAASHDKTVKAAEKSAESFGKWGTAAAVGIVGVAADMAMKVETAATAIAKAGGTSTEAGKKVEDAFRTIPGTVEYSAAKIGEAFSTIAGELKVVEGHALTTGQAMQVMKAALDLADASGNDLKSSTEALGKVMMTFHLHANQAAEATDVLFNASKVTGITVEEFTQLVDRARGRLGALAPSLSETAGFMAELAKQGVAGRLTMGSLGGMFGTLLSQSTKVNDTLKALNVHVFDNQGRFVGLKSVIEQLHPALSKYNEASQLAITRTLFGEKANKQLLEVLHQGVPAYEASTKAVSKHGTAADAAAKEHQTLAGKLKATRADFENISATLGERFIPILEKVASAISDSIKWLDKHKEAAKALEVVIGTVLGAAMADFAAVKVVKFVGGIKSMISAVQLLARTMLVTLVPAFATAEGEIVAGTVAASASVKAALLTTGIGAALALLATAAFELQEHWETVMKGLESGMESAANFVIDRLNEVIHGINKVTGALTLGLAPAIGEIKKMHKESEAEEGTGQWAGEKLSGGGTNAEAAAEGTPNERGGRNRNTELKNTGRHAVVEQMARKYGLDPKVLWGVYGTETGYGTNINTSSAGAQGAFQFIPETAHQYGYPLTNRPNAHQFAQQANAAARYLHDLIRENGGDVNAALRQYSGQTPGYAQKVAGNGASYGSESFTAPGKAEKVHEYMGPNGETLHETSAQHAHRVLMERKAKFGKPNVHEIDRWAEGSIGKFAESWGANQGPELNQLQKEFHTTAAAWCAEFATTAAMMGGANKAVRTASVATIREWAEQGSHGYRKGVGHTPHVGDMMMFGNSHVGFVQSVHGGQVGVIEGNANGSGGVVQRTRNASEGDFATPIYHKAMEGSVELANAGKAFAQLAKQAEAHLLLSPRQQNAVNGLEASALGAHNTVARYGSYATEAGQAWEAARTLQQKKVKPLWTAEGAHEQTLIDEQDIQTAKARKVYYEREVKALQQEASAWGKLRDSYRKFARHAHGNAKKEALNKAAAYDGKVKAAMKEAQGLGGTIAAVEAQIEEGQQVMSSQLPGEIAASQGEHQAGDLAAYQAALSKIGLEERAGILTPEQAKAAREDTAKRALGGGYGELSSEGKLQVQGDLREFAQALQEANSALEQHNQLQKESNKLLQEQLQASERIALIENGTLTKAMADLISGQIGGVDYHGRQATPGIGSAARY